MRKKTSKDGNTHPRACTFSLRLVRERGDHYVKYPPSWGAPARKKQQNKNKKSHTHKKVEGRWMKHHLKLSKPFRVVSISFFFFPTPCPLNRLSGDAMSTRPRPHRGAGFVCFVPQSSDGPNMCVMCGGGVCIALGDNSNNKTNMSHSNDGGTGCVVSRILPPILLHFTHHKELPNCHKAAQGKHAVAKSPTA